MSDLRTRLPEASHTNDIPSQTSSASQGTKTTIVGMFAGKAVQAMLPITLGKLSTLHTLAKKYDKAPSTQPKPVDVDTNLENYQRANPEGEFPNPHTFFDQNIAEDPLEESSKPLESDYPSSRGEPSTLKEPLLSKKEQPDDKTAGAENTGETPPAYEPPTLPTSLQEQ